MLRENDIVLANDNELVGQLSSRKYTITSSGKLAVEPKKEMKKRGLSSPDRADAVALSCHYVPRHIPVGGAIAVDDIF